MKRKYIFTAIIVFAVTASAVFIGSKVKTALYGEMVIKVTDGFSDEPIENAIVVIPETGERYTTDNEGNTQTIRLPVIYDSVANSLMPQNYGKITILVYADGYLPYALFYAHVLPNDMRSPEILMFPDDGGNPFILIESPDFEWANALLKKYKP